MDQKLSQLEHDTSFDCSYSEAANWASDGYNSGESSNSSNYSTYIEESHNFNAAAGQQNFLQVLLGKILLQHPLCKDISLLEQQEGAQLKNNLIQASNDFQILSNFLRIIASTLMKTNSSSYNSEILETLYTQIKSPQNYPNNFLQMQTSVQTAEVNRQKYMEEQQCPKDILNTNSGKNRPQQNENQLSEFLQLLTSTSIQCTKCQDLTTQHQNHISELESSRQEMQQKIDVLSQQNDAFQRKINGLLRVQEICYPGAKTIRDITDIFEQTIEWWGTVQYNLRQTVHHKQGLTLFNRLTNSLRELHSAHRCLIEQGRTVRSQVCSQVVEMENMVRKILETQPEGICKDLCDKYLQFPYHLKPMFDLMKEYEKSGVRSPNKNLTVAPKQEDTGARPRKLSE